MGRAVEGVLARLRERVAPRLAGLDGPRVPRTVVGRDGVDELIVVGPANGRAGGNLKALWLEGHRSHFRMRRIRRPFAAPRRPLAALCFSPPEVPAQREGNRELESPTHPIDAA